MAKTSVVLTYKGSVTPKKTSFLTSSPIDLEFETDYDVEPSDKANIKTLQKEFQLAMDKQIKTQLKALDTWLDERDEIIAGFMKELDALKKEGLPLGEAAAAKRAAALKKLESVHLKIVSAERDYRTIVDDWAENACMQQGLVARQMAIKAARMTTAGDKKARVRLGQGIKVTLAVAGIVLGAVAIFLSAGAATPIVLGIAIAAGALSGVASIADVGVSLSRNWNIEKKLMANLEADVKTVHEALDAAQQSGGKLAKHVTEMQNLMNLREDAIKQLQQKLLVINAPIKRLETDLGKLGDELIPAAERKAKEKEVAEIKDKADAVSGQIEALQRDNTQAAALLADLEAMVGDLTKLSSKSANSIGGNLKKRFSTFDGWADAGKQGLALGQALGKFAAAH